jgi:hypothetical protein
MEKIFKILSVFALLILIIVFSVYARERRFREYHLSKRIKMPPDMEPAGTRHTITVGAGEEGSRQAKDDEHQISFIPRREELGAAGDVLNREGVNDEAAIAEAGAANQEGILPGSESFIAVIEDLTKPIIARIPLAEHADLLIFDPVTRLLYCCSAEGALTIIRQHDRSIYKVIQRLEIPKGCSRLALDPDKGKLYVYAEGSVFIYTNE